MGFSVRPKYKAQGPNIRGPKYGINTSCCSIKKKSNHLFDVKKNLKESFRDYLRRFKVEKARIVRCNDSIARAAF